MRNFIILKIITKGDVWFPCGPDFPEDCISRTFEPVGSAFAPSATAAAKCFGSRDAFKAVEIAE